MKRWELILHEDLEKQPKLRDKLQLCINQLKQAKNREKEIRDIMKAREKQDKNFFYDIAHTLKNNYTKNVT